MRIVQVCIGRFHHFHLARYLQSRGDLTGIFSGFPWFKLREEGLPRDKVYTFPWIQTPYVAALRYPLISSNAWIKTQWEWQSHQSLDRHVARKLPACDAVVGLSGSALRAGQEAKRRGAKYVCDRGSTHIRYQDEILREEHAIWGMKWHGIGRQIMEKEEQEYEAADLITVPSSFNQKSFVEHGISPAKLRKISYGANFHRFSPQGSPAKDRFVVLFVGQLSLRKGIPYLLQAFDRFQHPNKELWVIGGTADSLHPAFRSWRMDKVQFLGNVPNNDLPRFYSRANVLVLPSIEEGLAMVQGEALACGCTVIASENTGARDLFEDGKEGFVVPIRDADTIVERLTRLADSPRLRIEMSVAALDRVKRIGGWANYGQDYRRTLSELVGERGKRACSTRRAV